RDASRSSVRTKPALRLARPLFERIPRRGCMGRIGSVLTMLAATSIALLGNTPLSHAADRPTYGPELEGFDYPYEVQRFRFTSQGTDVQMAYMDVKPQTPNCKTVVLLHGRNFCSATWGDTIAILSKAAFRVIAPDQIGFCKSTKPPGYQFSVQQLAT